MIDTRRWVLAEAWISLGLRIEYAGAYESTQIARDVWMADDDTGERYCYAGDGTWKMPAPSRPGFGDGPRIFAPSLSTGTMAHELAHYLTASAEARSIVNFGITPDDPEGEERRATDAEQTIDAMLGACDRILSQTLTGRARR